MANKKLGIFAIVLVSLIAIGGLVSAYGPGFDNPYRGTYREQMEEILETGTYEDLVSFREEIGHNVAPWVIDEDSFQQLKERHEYMEENGLEGGMRLRDGTGQGMQHGKARGMGMNCPFM